MMKTLTERSQSVLTRFLNHVQARVLKDQNGKVDGILCLKHMATWMETSETFIAWMEVLYELVVHFAKNKRKLFRDAL